MGLFQLQTLWNLMNNVEFQPPNPIKPYEEWDIPTANLMKPNEQSGIPTGNPIKPFTKMGLFQLRTLWNLMNKVEFQLETLPYEEWDIPTANLMKPDEQSGIPTSKPYQSLHKNGIFSISTAVPVVSQTDTSFHFDTGLSHPCPEELTGVGCQDCCGLKENVS